MKSLNPNQKPFLKVSRFLIILFIVLTSINSIGQTHSPITKTVNSYIKGYWEYLPENYNNSDKKFPLLIFLHGIGELGDGSQTSLQLVLRHGPPKLIKNNIFPKTFTVNGKTFSFIVISPQLTTNIRNESVVRSLIDYCVQNYKVDTSRIYLTGLSMGGGISWIYAGQTLTNANRLAALTPICANTDGWSGLVANVAKANIPTWIAHNKYDPVVPSSYSVNWSNGLKNYAPAMTTKPLLFLYDKSSHDAWSQTYDPTYRPSGLNVYEWMLQYSNGSSSSEPSPVAPNKAPVAIIKGTTNLSLPTNSTVLDGSSSSDADGTIKSYFWRYVSGPGSYLISDANVAKPTISNLIAGNYIFKLTVTDDKGATGVSDTTIVVNDVAKINTAPVAAITGTTNLVLPVNSTVLYGTSSTDNDGSIVSYLWQYVSGPTQYALSGSTTSTAKISNLAIGTYTFKLVVKDDKGATGSKSISIVVNESIPVIIPNTAPTAIITGSLNLTLPTNSTILNGSSSRDTDGVIKSYLWKYISGPSSYNLQGSTAEVATISNLVVGDYFFQLTVTDDDGATGIRTVKIVVNEAITNTAPIAIIKGSTRLVLPATSTILYGSSSTDADGTIKSYLWKYISGPSQYALAGDLTSTLKVSSLVKGAYKFQLTVTDDKGAKGSAYVDVNVVDNTGDTSSANANCGCTKYLQADAVGAIYTTGAAVKAVPGDVICIKAGKYKSIRLADFHGTSTKPIIFKNCGGKVIVSGYNAYGISMTKSTNFRFTGNGSGKEFYGFLITSAAPDPYVSTGFSAGYLTSDFEVDHIEVARASAGVWIKTQVTTDPLTWDSAFTMRNVRIHDMHVRDTKGEGYYIGHTAPTVNITVNGQVKTIVPQAIQNLRLFRCIAENTGWDGIQVAAVTANCFVYNNKVSKFGTANAVSQQYGILFGGRCNGAVFNNYIANGTGAGVEVFARNKATIFNNSIYNVGYDNTTSGQDGIFIDDRSLVGTAPLTVFVANNTIVKPKRDGIRFLNSYKNQSTGNIFYNNLVVSPGTFRSYYTDTLKSAIDVIDKTMHYTATNNLCLSNIEYAKFKDAANANFELTTTSPARNKGKDLSPWNVKTDIRRILRPQGGVFDIGAYELLTDTVTQQQQSNLVTNSSSSNLINAGSDINNSITLAPVPVRDRLQIMLKDEVKGKIAIKVSDASGKIVLTNTNFIKDQTDWRNSISVNNLPAGMYYLEATVIEKKFQSKFLVVK